MGISNQKPKDDSEYDKVIAELVGMFGNELWFYDIQKNCDDAGWALDVIVDKNIWDDKIDPVPRMVRRVPVRVMVKYIHKPVGVSDIDVLKDLDIIPVEDKTKD